MTPDQNSNKILLVEGQDDKHIVWQLCRRKEATFWVNRSEYHMRVNLRHRASDFLISEKGNSFELLESIAAEIQAPDRQAVGIMVDANGEPEKRWEAVKQAFPPGVQLPSSPDPAGTILPEQDDRPRIGVWLMPDNGSAGELEDFVLQMIPASDAVWPFSQSYIEQIPVSDRKFTPAKTDKAKLYAWLATRNEPGRMGAAVGAGDLEVNGTLCQNFFSWLTNLFG